AEMGGHLTATRTSAGARGRRGSDRVRPAEDRCWKDCREGDGSHRNRDKARIPGAGCERARRHWARIVRRQTTVELDVRDRDGPLGSRAEQGRVVTKRGMAVRARLSASGRRSNMAPRNLGFASLAAGILWLLVPCAQAQISNDTVKIGVLADMSGLYSDLSGIGSVVAARMAAEDFGGVVLGKKIEIVSADLQNKPDIRSNICRKWNIRQGIYRVSE